MTPTNSVDAAGRPAGAAPLPDAARVVPEDWQRVVDQIDTLLGAPSPEAAARDLVRLVVPAVAGSAVVILRADDGTFGLTALAHGLPVDGPALEGAVRRWIARPEFAADVGRLLSRAAAGDTATASHAPADGVLALPDDVRAVGGAGMAMVPLVGRAGLLGLFGFATREGAGVTEPAVQLARRLGQRAGVVIEHVRRTAALARQAADLQTVITAFPDLYFWTDAEGRIVDFQAGRAAELALLPEAFLGRRADELFPGELGTRFHRATAQALATGQVVAIEYALDTPAGPQWFEARYAPTAADRVIAIIRNITDRRAAEAEAHRIDEQYRLVTDGLPVLISYVGADGRFRFVNAAYETTYGMPREAFVGRPIAEVIGAEAYERARPHLERTLAGSSASFPNVLLTPDGRRRHMAVSFVPHRDPGGAVVGLFAMAIDVTEQHALEERLRQAQKLEAIGQLAGGVAHDFNNLLTVIITSTEFARESLPDDAPARVELMEIEAAAERAAALVRQLLTFSRKQVSRVQPVAVGRLVVDAERMLRRVIGEEIVLEVHVADGDATVLADAGQLEQVLMNLAVNARDAMLTPKHGHPGTGGALSLEVATVSPGAEELGVWAGASPELAAGRRWVRVTVSDTGHGMDAATRAHVFEPFFTTKPVGQGTGLGLATVFGVVRQAGGAVHVESAPGRGTTFTILLPATEPGPASTAAAAARASADATPTPGATVLLVEDEGAVRLATRRLLQRHGFVVLEARHGEDAWVLWTRHRAEIAAVVSDLRMPELGGEELVARLRRERPELPAVFISGYADHALTTDGAGVTAFVAKPFDADTVLAALRDVLRTTPRRGGTPMA